jgi:protoporphyrinogen oxidase
VVLPGDTCTIRFIEELGLISELSWNRTETGFYGEQKLVSLSSTLDFLRFPFLNLWQKFRMGLGILHSVRIRESSRLDRMYAGQWLTRVFGKKVYENIWKPLLRSKLGDASEKTSAAFIWAIIRRLYGARKSGAKQEQMGYVRGGYFTILSAAKEKLADLNVRIITEEPILNVKLASDRRQISVTSKSYQSQFDKVLLTPPFPEVSRIMQSDTQSDYRHNLENVQYLGLICVLIILRRRLSPYYVINLLDRDLPFTGIIESTNVLPPEDFGGRHLLYLPKYLVHDDPLNSLKDDRIRTLFIEKLRRVFKHLLDDHILHVKVFRERYVQPVQELNYLDRSIGFRTPIKNVYIANSSMIQNSTVNNNATIDLANRVAKMMIEDTP